MLEAEESGLGLRKGFRLYSSLFSNEHAELWRTRLEETDGREFINALESKNLGIRLAWAEGLRDDGSEYKRLNLYIWRPERPMKDDERKFIAHFFPEEKVLFWPGFPETQEPLNEGWDILYSTPEKKDDTNLVSEQLRKEVDEVLAPQIDRDVPQEDIEIAVTAAELNSKYAWTGDQITHEQVQQRIDFANRFWKMRASGFYRVISIDTWEHDGDPRIAGEFENLEDARERIEEDILRERNFLRKIDPEGFISGKPLTSSVLYLYGPAGQVIGEFPI